MQDLLKDEDLGRMYELIMDALAESGDGRSKEFMQRLALASLCKFGWPGKLPSYRQELERLQGQFKGIAKDPYLVRRFRAGLSPVLLQASSTEDITFTSIRDLYAPELSSEQRMNERRKVAGRRQRTAGAASAATAAEEAAAEGAEAEDAATEKAEADRD